MNSHQRRIEYRKLVARAKAVGATLPTWRASRYRIEQLIREAINRNSRSVK